MEVGARLTSLLLTHCGARRAPAREVEYASAALRDAESASFPRYCGALLSEVLEEAKPQAAREEAARLLRECVSSAVPSRSERIEESWLAAQPPVKAQLRNMAAQGLDIDFSAGRRAAGEAAAAFARVDLPRGEWSVFLTRVCAAAGGGRRA
eukprot:Hpha_TRINITY_DN15262_c1_g7::TRINITY_DN15262_c1_g7_i1::g.64290::m.64290